MARPQHDAENEPPRGPASAPTGADLRGLVGRVATGDAEALGALYDATRLRTFGFVLRIGGDRAGAEEALIDVYEQAWRIAHTFDASRGGVETWLFQLARTRALDYVRSRGRRARRFASLDTASAAACDRPAPPDRAADAEQSERLRGAVRRLPPAQRDAVETAYFGGLSYAEAAAALSVPVGTFKTRMRSALAALRAAGGGDAETETPR